MTSQRHRQLALRHIIAEITAEFLPLLPKEAFTHYKRYLLSNTRLSNYSINSLAIWHHSADN